MFSLLYLLSVGLSRLDVWFHFPREFNVLVRFFVSGVTWSVRASSGKPKNIAPWCYGFGTVLDFIDGWFSRWESSGPARVGGRSCESGKRSFEEFPRVQIFKRVKPCSRESRERARALARRFKLSGFGHRPQAAGPIRASVRGGAPPMSRLSGVEFTWSDIPFIPWEIQTYRFYMHVYSHMMLKLNGHPHQLMAYDASFI